MTVWHEETVVCQSIIFNKAFLSLLKPIQSEMSGPLQEWNNQIRLRIQLRVINKYYADNLLACQIQ